jgi:cyclohexadienyl dehydratase
MTEEQMRQVLAREFLIPIAAAALLLWSTFAPAQAPSRLDAIVSRGTLRVGLTGDYRPFSSFDQATSRFAGFDVDMMGALAQALGVKVEFVPTTWPTMARDFEAGAFDIAAGGVSITLDRQKTGWFSAPLMRDGKTPIARCADAARFQTLADIDRPGVRVIVNPGGTNERFARANLKRAEIAVYPDNRKIFDEIAVGHADLMITDASETRFQQKEHAGVLCAVHPDRPFDLVEKAYWLPRDVALKIFVDRWLHGLMEDGSFRKTYDRWFN